MRKILFIISTLLVLAAGSVMAQDVRVDFFYSPTCPHCSDGKVFLEGLDKDYPQIEIREMNTWESGIMANSYFHQFSMTSSLPFVPTDT